MQAKRRGVFALRTGNYQEPKNWTWHHPRVNVFILKLNAPMYVAEALKGTPEAGLMLHDPTYPHKMVESIYWGRMGVKAFVGNVRRARHDSKKSSKFEAALKQAKNICRGLEQAGHVVLWGGLKP